MGALNIVVAADIVNDALTFYVRGKALSQTMQDKPLLKFLRSGQKNFPGGKDNISEPVQGAYMSDVAGFFQGYSEDDALSFTQAQNVLRASVPWKECAANLIISWTELKKDGITVNDHQKTSEHSQRDLTVLTGMLENRLDDFNESWARAMNKMLWLDGGQDAKQIPGVRSILQDAGPAAAAQTIEGLSTTTYPFWNFRARMTGLGAGAITPSADDQNLSRVLRHELIQLKRYGGKPDKALCGSDFIDALLFEVQAKGQYTQEGFTRETKTDLGMATVNMMGLGKFEYDPTLDDMGFGKRCYIFDSRRIKLRPMEGEDNKLLTPERPYQYLVFLRTMTYTGGLIATQLNCHGVYDVV